MAKSLKDLAKEALEVQDACNLSGVVKSWARAIDALWDALRASGEPVSTSTVNEHPINVMWASKVESLTNAGSPSTFSGAYDECVRLSLGLSEEVELGVSG